MKSLLNIGVSEDLEEFQRSLVKNSNLSSVVLSVIALFLTTIFYIHSPENIGFGLVFFVPAIFTFLLNALGNTQFSRIIFVVLTSLVIAAAHGYFVSEGKPVMMGVFLAQFSLFFLLAVLFDTRERFAAGLSAGLLIAIFLGFPFLDSALNIHDEIEIFRSVPVVRAIYAVDLLGVLGSLAYIQRKKFNSEKEYERTLQQLKEKKEALEKQEKELQQTFDEIRNTHKEDDKRNWISEGIGQLNNMLRGSNDQNLFSKVLSHVVKYLGANQGAIYEAKEDNFGSKFLATKAFYGVERSKSVKDRIDVEEEGILGDAYKEMAPVYRVEVPQNYTIESGLGQTRAGSLFVVPMVYENNIEGMLELAAFKKLEDHEKEYVRKVSDILARFIESYQVNSQSQELLEKTNQQTEEMRAQEEEMRQNMEELQATQEELHRKEREYIAKIKELENKLKA